MKKQLAEEAVLLIAVVKWLILATTIGMVVGLSTTLLLNTLYAVNNFLSGIPYAIGFLPLALLLSAWITSTIAPEAAGQGIERVIQAVHLRSGKIDLRVIPAKIIATILTICTGGSAGTVGPCAQIGSSLASLFANIFHFTDTDRRTLVICAISAAFSTVLGTPLAGAIFGLEVLFVGYLTYEVLFPSAIAAIAGHQMALALGMTYWNVALPSIPVMNGQLFLFIALAGVFFGLCATLLIECTHLGQRIALQLNLRPPILGLLGGSVLVGLSFAFSAPFLGLGDQVVPDIVNGQDVIWYAFLLKILATSITLSFGGSGGIIMPICVVGAMAGAWFGTVFNLQPELFAALGLVGLLAGAANAPLAAIVLALELFGSQVGIYALMVGAMSFLICGHRSAIPTQVVRMKKATAISVKQGQEICDTQTTMDIDQGNFVGMAKNLISRWAKRKSRN